MPRCGLFYVGDLKKRSIPLEGIHVSVRIVDLIAEVQIVQFYVNRTNEVFDALYEFPLDEKSAVCGFEAELGEKLLIGEVKEKEEAKVEYDAAIERGETALLLQEKKPDVFVQRVGNIQPRSRVNVRITYVTEVAVESDGSGRFILPTTISPRYGEFFEDDFVPFLQPWYSSVGRRYYFHEQFMSWRNGGDMQLPFAAWRTIPNRIAHRAGPCLFSLTLELESASKILAIESPSHKIDVDIAGNGREAAVELWNETEKIGKDFILRFHQHAPHEPKVMVELAPDGSGVAMFSMVPDFDLEPEPTEVIFLLDCSGSMSGSRIKASSTALQVLLQSLPMACHFNVWRFGSEFDQVFPQSAPYSAKNLSIAMDVARNLRADYGGTELAAPLSAIFAAKVRGGKKRQLFVLTDGDIWDTDAVLDLVRRNASNTRLFSVGIGDEVSRALVEGLARSGNGTSEFVSSHDLKQAATLDAKLVSQLAQATQPALTELQVDWGERGGAVLPSYSEAVNGVADSKKKKKRHSKRKSSSGLPPWGGVGSHGNKQVSKFFQTGPKSLHGYGKGNKIHSPNAVQSGPLPDDVVDQLVENHAQPLGRNNVTYQAPFLPPPIFSGSKSELLPSFLPMLVLYNSDSHVTVKVQSPTDGELKMEVPVTRTVSKGKTLHVLAARHLLRDLEEGKSSMHYEVGSVRHGLNPFGLVPVTPRESRVREETIKIAVEYGLVSKYTAFVAVQRFVDGHSGEAAEPLQLPSEADAPEASSEESVDYASSPYGSLPQNPFGQYGALPSQSTSRVSLYSTSPSVVLKKKKKGFSFPKPSMPKFLKKKNRRSVSPPSPRNRSRRMSRGSNNNSFRGAIDVCSAPSADEIRQKPKKPKKKKPARLKLETSSDDESEKEEEAPTALLLQQEFEGSFLASATVLSWLNITAKQLSEFSVIFTEQELSTIGQHALLTVITTLAVLYLLSSKYSSTESSWKLIAQKARTYVAKVTGSKKRRIQALIDDVGARF